MLLIRKVIQSVSESTKVWIRNTFLLYICHWYFYGNWQKVVWVF